MLQLFLGVGVQCWYNGLDFLHAISVCWTWPGVNDLLKSQSLLWVIPGLGMGATNYAEQGKNKENAKSQGRMS